MVKLTHIIHYVPSIEKAVDFYSKAFGFSCKFMHESKTYAEMSTGDCTLAFADVTLAKHNLPNGFQELNPKKPPFASQITFTTDNVKVCFDKALKNGAISLKEPELKPWGQTCAYVQDPFGSLVEIASPM